MPPEDGKSCMHCEAVLRRRTTKAAISPIEMAAARRFREAPSRLTSARSAAERVSQNQPGTQQARLTAGNSTFFYDIDYQRIRTPVFRLEVVQKSRADGGEHTW